MSRFDYDDYEASHQQPSSGGFGAKADFVYLSKYLKNDGDYVVVRFPYATTKDFEVVHAHKVTLPDRKYPDTFECLRNDGDSADVCPLCKDNNPVVNRFLVKAIVYIKEDSASGTHIVPKAAVWDRPFMFAKDIAGKIEEYGDLRNHLFKIKRSGTGTDTKYSVDIVLNASVYNPEIYKADFSVLDGVNPSFILLRNIKSLNGKGGQVAKTAQQKAAQSAPNFETVSVLDDELPFSSAADTLESTGTSGSSSAFEYEFN